MRKSDILPRLILMLVPCIFLLSDMYYQGVGRLFDYVSIVILLLCAYTLGISEVGKSVVAYGLPLFTMSLVGITIGFFNGNALASFAILTGVLLVLPITVSLIRQGQRHYFESAVYLTIWGSIFFFYVQLVTYYSFGAYLDFSSFFGSIESRGVNVGLNYFRPHGIFQEPNGYCTSMFCLLTLTKYFLVRRKALEYMGILTLFLSLSLWGMLAGASLLVFLYFRFSSKTLINLSMLSVIIFYAFASLDWSDLTSNSVTLNRILNLEDDSSFSQRSGDMNILAAELDNTFLWGSGVNTNLFQGMYGANGLSFLVYSFGIVGTVLLLVTLLIMLRFSLVPLLFLAVLLTTYPPFSYMYFWLWLGLLIMTGRRGLQFSYKNLGQGV